MAFSFDMPTPRTLKKTAVYGLLAANALGILYLWLSHSGYYLQNPGGGNFEIALGRIAGLFGEYVLLVQLVLIGRIKWVEHVFGFDKMNTVHRWTGYSILSLLLAHPLLLVIGYARQNGVSLLSQLGDFLANSEHVILAYFALLLFIFIVVFSIAIVRRRMRYETWYFVHLLTYLAIGLAFTHQLETGDLRNPGPLAYWYLLNFAVFGSFVLFRFVRPLWLYYRHRFVIREVVQETKDTWSLYIGGKDMKSFAFEPGQYANITILARGMWYTHPFSLSAPYNGESIRFSIKGLGDYTWRIKFLKPGTPVVIDGPLGQFVAHRAERKKYLCIAGGIGITPIRSMLEPLAQSGKDAVLLYANRTEQDIVFRGELADLERSYPALHIHHVLGTPSPGYESGYIDKEKIVRLVPDFYEREVFLCGPSPMMKAMVSILRGLGFDASHIHYERFAF